ncbi:MAG: thiamine ABC transporter substrate-binding protein [Acidimicrobiales bacterium]
MSLNTTRSHLFTAVALALALVAAGCGDDDNNSRSNTSTENESACFSDPELEAIDVSDLDMSTIDGTEVSIVAYDSFFVSEGIFEQFEEETGISVTVLTSASTGAMVSEAVLTAGNPVADVMWGIDNTFLCAGLEAEIFTPYISANLNTVPDELKLDPHNRVTPVDFSDMCINYWIDALETDPPTAIEDLAKPEFSDAFVTENPETSPPGMGFLLSTIATFGEDGWQAYWQDLADNGVAVTPGWSEAYYGEFTAGGGDRPIVMSYASSPVAELLFADPPVDTPPTDALLDSCFRSIEFAGVLKGTENPEAAALLVDFLLSTTFQEDIPLNMFVFPANEAASLPPEFVEWAPLSPDPHTVAPELIEANRDQWTEEWTEIVLR